MLERRVWSPMGAALTQDKPTTLPPPTRYLLSGEINSLMCCDWSNQSNLGNWMCTLFTTGADISPPWLMIKTSQPRNTSAEDLWRTGMWVSSTAGDRESPDNDLSVLPGEWWTLPLPDLLHHSTMISWLDHSPPDLPLHLSDPSPLLLLEECPLLSMLLVQMMWTHRNLLNLAWNLTQ